MLESLTGLYMFMGLKNRVRENIVVVETTFLYRKYFPVRDGNIFVSEVK